MSNPAPTLNQINAFNATQGTTIDFNIIGGTEVIRSNKIYIYDLSDNSLICTHLYVSTESIHELPPNTSSSIVYASGKSSADFTNNTQYYAQIQTFTDVGGTQGGSGLSIAKLFWCLPTPTLTLSTIPTTISTTSYNVSATYTPNTSGSATNEIQEFQFNLYSAIGALLQTSGVMLYGDGVDLSYNFSGLEVDSTYYVTLDVTTTQGMNVSAQSNTFTVSIDTPTMGSASVVNNGCDGYISVTSNLSSEYEHEESAEAGEIMSFTTDSVNDITELDVDFSPVQDGTPWMSAQDTTPYIFRVVPTQTEDFGHESDTIVGGTVAWNQLIESSNAVASNTKFGVTITAMSNKFAFTISGTCEPPTSGDKNIYIMNANPPKSFVAGHKYLVTNTSKFFCAYVYGVGSPSASVSGNRINVNNQKGVVLSCTTSGQFFISLHTGSNIESNTSINENVYINVFDLTTMFGSTIADYIYSLEQANAGAGVAWFRKLFPKPYYAYNAGELMSVNTSAHNTVGFNAWDEEWELGALSATGGNATSSTEIRSKNYILVVGGQTYYLYCAVASTFNYKFYDADKNFISGSYISRNNTLTIPNDARCMRFFMGAAYGTTYNNDICINLSDASLNGTYKPYVKHSYPLDSTLTLRGIPKLDASNKLYYDGDRYNADGSVDRRYHEVDLASFSWNTRYTGSTNKTLSVDMTGYAYKTVNGVPNMIGAPYSRIESVGGVVALNDPDNKSVGIYSYTQSMSGIAAYSTIYIVLPKNDSPSGKLVYELATPTTETADPYTNPQIVDPHGTEQYVGSPIPVGHETTYQRICPISGWDSVSVDVVGKNFVDITSVATTTTSNWGVSISGNVLTVEHKNTYSTGLPRTADMALKAGTYCISYTASTNIVVDIYANGSWLKAINTGGTFTLSADSTVYVAFPNMQATTITYQNVQLESGSTPTSYVPYNPNSTTYTSTFPKYKQQVTQDKIPYITKNIGDTYADTLTENLVGGTIAWNQSVPDTTTTHTVSGNIASMDDAVAGNFESVVCDIEPLQDLHGYDKPWVGGAGKNLLLEAPSGTYNQNGITVVSDGKGKFTINGTATANCYADFTLSSSVTLPNSSLYLHALNDFVSGSVALVFLNGSTQIGNPTMGTSTNKIVDISSWASGATFNKVRVYVNNGASLSNVTIQPMICTTNSVIPWQPYSNLCPITGWTGCEVVVSPTEDEQDGTTYHVSWQTEAGTVYGGTVDVVSGVLTVDRVGVLLNTADMDNSETYPGWINQQWIQNLKMGESGSSAPVGSLMNITPFAGNMYGVNRYRNIVWLPTGAYGKTQTEWQALAMDVQFVMPLATPQTYQLDPVQVACLLGRNNVWNNISNTTVTYPTNHSYQSLSTTHKYYKRINGVESISVGSDVVVDVGTDNIIDLTQMFGTTIADYIYNREQSSSSGMGVKFFKSLFPNDDYDYNSGTLISVNASAHVIKDANGNVLHTYPLDSDLVLRGIPKLDANNKLYYDGDVYEPDGSVTRKYGIVDLGSLNWTTTTVSGHTIFWENVPNGKMANINYNGICSKYPLYNDDTYSANKSLRLYGNSTYQFSRAYIRDDSYTDAASFKSAMSGVYLVYELNTSTTESADPFEENQTIVSNGIEEYIVTEQGDVEMPVGHDSTYYATEVYGGTIDMASGVLIVEWASITLNGSNSWVSQDTLTTTKHYSCDISGITASTGVYNDDIMGDNMPTIASNVDSIHMNHRNVAIHVWIPKDIAPSTYFATNPLQVVYPLATPITMQLTPQQMQTLSGQNNIWSNTNGGMYLVYQLPITSLLVKRRDVADVSGKWLTLYSTPITQASDMDFTFIDFLNQYGKTYQYALVPVLAQDQSGVIVQIEGGYTVSDNVDSIFDGVYIADQTNVERVKAGVGYGNIDMNQGVGSITPIGSKYPIVITNSQNQYHNGSIRGTIVPNDFYSNGNLSRMDMVNKRDELEQFLTNKRAKIIKDWNGKMWLVMIMSNVACSFDDNYGMGMVSFSADWLEVGDPMNQQDLYNAGLINVGGV